MPVQEKRAAGVAGTLHVKYFKVLYFRAGILSYRGDFQDLLTLKSVGAWVTLVFYGQFIVVFWKAKFCSTIAFCNYSSR